MSVRIQLHNKRSNENRENEKVALRRRVMRSLVSSEISVDEAASILKLSARQIYRIKARLKKGGVALLAHGNKGRKPPNRIDSETWKQVIELARTTYSGVAFGDLSEILAKKHNIHVGRESLRKQLRAANVPPKRSLRVKSKSASGTK